MYEVVAMVNVRPSPEWPWAQFHSDILFKNNKRCLKTRMCAFLFLLYLTIIYASFDVFLIITFYLTRAFRKTEFTYSLYRRRSYRMSSPPQLGFTYYADLYWLSPVDTKKR
jgi:hypothetical protein